MRGFDWLDAVSLVKIVDFRCWISLFELTSMLGLLPPGGDIGYGYKQGDKTFFS